MVMLTVKDRHLLHFLASKLGWSGIDVEHFHEPDLDNELTAIAVADPLAWRKLAGLPLLMREGVNR